MRNQTLLNSYRVKAKACLRLLPLSFIWVLVSFSAADPLFGEQLIKQETTDKQSPAVIAEGNVTITYGISEKTFNEIQEILKGKDKVIEQLLKNLIEKDIAQENRDTIIRSWTRKYKELESRVQNSPFEDPLIKMAKKRLDDGDIDGVENLLAIAQLASEAGVYEKIGEYQSALDTYNKALKLDPMNQIIHKKQLNLTINWLMDNRRIGLNALPSERENMLQVIDEFISVLITGLSKNNKDDEVKIQSFLGWAYFLKGRDVPVSVNTEDIFRNALRKDPDNIYANAMLGYWLLTQKAELESASLHFDLALKENISREWVRELQLGAFLLRIVLLNRINTEDKFRTPPLSNMMKKFISIANDMRINNEPLPGREVRLAIIRCYGMGYSGEYVDMLIQTLPPDEQLKTVQWLSHGLDYNTSSGKSQERYVIARLTEASGDIQQAIRLFKDMAKEDFFFDALNVRVDDALYKLTGEQTERMKKRMSRKYINDIMKPGDDPWEFHAETMLNFHPDFLTENQGQALDYFIKEVGTGPLAARVPEAISIFEKSREHIRLWIEDKERQRKQIRSYWGEYTESAAGIARINYYIVWDQLGVMYIKNGDPERAVVELDDLYTKVESDSFFLDKYEDMKYQIAYNLSCAYSQRSVSDRTSKNLSDNQGKDILTAIEYLKKSIEGKNRLGMKVEWESIKNDADLDPLHFHDEYKELIRGR